jgi:hypothetical protein
MFQKGHLVLVLLPMTNKDTGSRKKETGRQEKGYSSIYGQLSSKLLAVWKHVPMCEEVTPCLFMKMYACVLYHRIFALN